MLLSLYIENIMLFKKASISFKKGFNVILGETGSGKSFLIDCLNIVLGERSKSEMIRNGYDQGVIIAQFAIADNLNIKALIEENHINMEDGILTLKKVINRAGANRAYINDMPISNNLITAFGAMLVEVHGQFSQQLSAANYQSLLDSYLQLNSEAQEVCLTYKMMRDSQNNYISLLEKQKKIGEEREFQEKMIKDISALNISSNDEELQLIEKRSGYSSLAQASSIITQLAGNNSENKLLLPLYQIQKGLIKLSGMLTEKPFSDIVATANENLEKALSHLQETIAALEELKSSQNFDEDEFEKIDDRIHQLRFIARKYATDSNNLIKMLEESRAQIKDIENLEDLIEDAKNAFEKSKADYLKYAMALSNKRRSGAEGFEKRIIEELGDLKLQNARFKTIITSDQNNFYVTGIDKIEFTASMNPGIALNAIHKIASGGELSRFMLAFRIVTAAKMNIPTLILDEVDAGTSGIVATAIGNKMIKLGGMSQILVITHSHQIAAKAEHYYKIEKTILDNNTNIGIRVLEDEEIVEEIATLISGKKPLEDDLAAARKLLLQKLS